MAVPKCRSCNFLKELDALEDIYSGDKRRIHTGLSKNRACFHTLHVTQKRYPTLTNSEMKTSPEWCPLRKK